SMLLLLPKRARITHLNRQLTKARADFLDFSSQALDGPNIQGIEWARPDSKKGVSQGIKELIAPDNTPQLADDRNQFRHMGSHWVHPHRCIRDFGSSTDSDLQLNRGLSLRGRVTNLPRRGGPDSNTARNTPVIGFHHSRRDARNDSN